MISFLDQDAFSFIKCLFIDTRLNEYVGILSNISFILMIASLVLASYILLRLSNRISNNDSDIIFKVVLVEQFIELLNIIVYNVITYYFPAYILVYQISLILFLILAFEQFFRNIYIIYRLCKNDTVNIARSVFKNRISSSILYSFSTVIYFILISVGWYYEDINNVSRLLWLLTVFLFLIQELLFCIRIKLVLAISNEKTLQLANDRNYCPKEHQNDYFISFLLGILTA